MSNEGPMKSAKKNYKKYGCPQFPQKVGVRDSCEKKMGVQSFALGKVGVQDFSGSCQLFTAP